MTAKFALWVRTWETSDVQFQCPCLPVQPSCSFAFAAHILPALLIMPVCHFFKLAGRLKFLFMFLSKRRTLILYILTDEVREKSWSDTVTVSQQGELKNWCSLWGFQRSWAKFITEHHCKCQAWEKCYTEIDKDPRCWWVIEGYFWYP